MPQANLAKVTHLEWAVRSRARNQQCALRLFTLFEQHEKQWKTMKWARAAQDLLAVSFSLWRAAFLADKSGQRTAVFSDAKEFLEKIIEDNTISYSQDRKCKEWTFNYYTRNARSSLQVLARFWPDQVAEYTGRKRTPTERWEYCQQLLENAVAEFEATAFNLQAATTAAREARAKKSAARAAARNRKNRSRKITLAARAGK
jgi:hypothetical protein